MPLRDSCALRGYTSYSHRPIRDRPPVCLCQGRLSFHRHIVTIKEIPAFVATHIDAVLSRLLPDTTALHLDACTLDNAASRITLQVRSTQATARCPLCATRARRIHSHYKRTLADLPWAQYRVRLQLCVRKWFCRKRRCRRRIFTERLPTVAAPWARRTLRLAQRLIALGVALGGAAAVYLCRRWNSGVSRNTLLRLLRRLPLPSYSTPAVLGVDDFALCKRQSWVNLNKRQKS